MVSLTSPLDDFAACFGVWRWHDGGERGHLKEVVIEI